MDQKPLINLQFVDSTGVEVSLIGSDFSVRQEAVLELEKAEPELVTTRNWIGRTVTKSVPQGNDLVCRIVPDTLRIEGGALQSSYKSGSHQASHAANNITFAQYAETLTKALEDQATRPVILVDLASVQRNNLSKLESQ